MGKWQKGRRYTPGEAFAAIEASLPVYLNHKWTHNGWARSWQVNMVIANANAGRIFEAIRINGDVDERRNED